MDSDPDKSGYKKILIKLSGEALMGPTEFGIHTPTVESICTQIKEIRDLDKEVGVVVGGGNIFRGLHASERGMDRVAADHMGMLATAINALALMDTLEGMGVYTRVMSAVRIEAFMETYICRRAIRHMEKGRVVIFAAGTGNPFFSTDTAASLRAMEVGADVLIKATQVDGVYSEDPKKNPEAEFFPKLDYMDVLRKNLRVIDLTAISLLKENDIPLRVVDIGKAGNLRRAACGENVGTLVS